MCDIRNVSPVARVKVFRRQVQKTGSELQSPCRPQGPEVGLGNEDGGGGSIARVK